MKTLILTLPPHIPGGVASKAKILADHLRQLGQEVTIGFYAARGAYPDLNLSALQTLSTRRPRSRALPEYGDHSCIAVGCRLPELEFSYTEPSPLWTSLIQSHDRHIAVGGTVLMANPLVSAGVRHLVWCAGDVEGDRQARRRAMPAPRRWVDEYYVSRKLRQQQQRVLACAENRILGVSPFSLASLQKVQPRDSSRQAVLPIPTDMAFFSPNPETAATRQKSVIGFAGRLDDPRKNPELLFQSVAALRARGSDVALHVTGLPSPRLTALADRYGLAGQLTFLGRLSRQGLRDFYRSLSLFMIASQQEGLAIVGVEAMACGVPVIATRCGGPEAYVEDGVNGYLCPFDADALAERAERLLRSEPLHAAFSDAARSGIVETYSQAGFELGLKTQWRALWGEDPNP